MSTAAAQLKRLLTLIPHLSDGDEHSVDEIAAIVGIPVTQLIDDLRSLVDRYDLPGGFVEGVRIFQDDKNVSVTTPHFHRPMRLTMSELCVLELGLAIVIRERPPDEIGPARQAIEKLRQVMTRIPGDEKFDGIREASMEAGGVPAERLAALRKAVINRRKVRLLYRKGSSSQSEWRVVCPYTLAFTNGMWYVVAYCERDADLRFFRLDRVEEVEIRSESYEIPADFSPEALFKEGKPFMSGETAETVRVRYSAQVARWIAEREGRQLEPDGTLVVDRPLSDRSWAVRHVLQYGPEAEVLEPHDMRQMVMERLRSM